LAEHDSKFGSFASSNGPGRNELQPQLDDLGDLERGDTKSVDAMSV